MKIGSSSKIIKYHENKPLIGFAANRPCDGVMSDCKVRSLVLSGDEYYIIVQIDTLGVDDYFYNIIVDNLINKNFKKENIIVCATHTHSSYAGLIKAKGTVMDGLESVFGDFDEEYSKEIIDNILITAKEAMDDLQDFKVKVANGVLEGIGKERHDINYEGDDHLFCLEFIQENKKKILLYNFSCHPTVLHQDNFKLSADLVTDQHFNDYKDVFFINGSAGNISTRFTRKGSDEKEILRMGKIIQEEVTNLLQNCEEKELKSFDIRQVKIPMKVRKCDSLEVAELKLVEARNKYLNRGDVDDNRKRVLESYVEGAQSNYLLSKNLKDCNEIIFNSSIISSNLFEIVTVPCEIFSTLTKSLRNNGIIIFGYTNGYYLYLADKESALRGDYEAMSSIFEKGEGEKLTKMIEELL